MTTYQKYTEKDEERLVHGTKIRWESQTQKELIETEIIQAHTSGWGYWVKKGEGRVLINFKRIKEIEVPRKKKEESEEPAGKPSLLEEVITSYIKTREEIAEKKKEFEASVASMKELQTKRENYLSSQLDKLGADSLKTGAGTCFLKTNSSATVADAAMFTEWVLENWEERNHFLERRVSKTAVDEHINDKNPPPAGVNYTTMRVVQVRRA